MVSTLIFCTMMMVSLVYSLNVKFDFVVFTTSFTHTHTRFQENLFSVVLSLSRDDDDDEEEEENVK